MPQPPNRAADLARRRCRCDCRHRPRLGRRISRRDHPPPARSAAQEQAVCRSSRAFLRRARPPAPIASCRRASRSVDRRARRARLCRPRRRRRAARSAPELRAGLRARSTRAGRRGLPDASTSGRPALDSAQAAGDGVVARRRLRQRLGQLAALRRRQPRPPRRRRGRHGQPPAQHLRLSPSPAVGGERYAQSGNAGMLDMVAALEWVRDNIALRRRPRQRHDLRRVGRRRIKTLLDRRRIARRCRAPIRARRRDRARPRCPIARIARRRRPRDRDGRKC